MAYENPAWFADFLKPQCLDLNKSLFKQTVGSQSAIFQCLEKVCFVFHKDVRWSLVIFHEVEQVIQYFLAVQPVKSLPLCKPSMQNLLT